MLQPSSSKPTIWFLEPLSPRRCNLICQSKSAKLVPTLVEGIICSSQEHYLSSFLSTSTFLPWTSTIISIVSIPLPQLAKIKVDALLALLKPDWEEASLICCKQKYALLREGSFCSWIYCSLPQHIPKHTQKGTWPLGTLCLPCTSRSLKGDG